MKSVKDMNLQEQIQLCIDHGYDIDGDVHNGEAFFIIPPNASIGLRRLIAEAIIGKRIPSLQEILSAKSELE